VIEAWRQSTIHPGNMWYAWSWCYLRDDDGLTCLELKCRLLCKTVLLMIVHGSSCFAALASCVLGCKSTDWHYCVQCFFLLLVLQYQLCSLYIRTIMLTCPHDMQQLHCVPLVNWISDTHSQGCTAVQSLVNLHHEESDSISSHARLH